MTDHDQILIIIHFAFAIAALPFMLFCEYNSSAPGHRHVTYGKALALLFISAVPVVNIFAVLFCANHVFGDSVRARLSKHMIKETK